MAIVEGIPITQTDDTEESASATELLVVFWLVLMAVLTGWYLAKSIVGIGVPTSMTPLKTLFFLYCVTGAGVSFLIGVLLAIDDVRNED